MHLVEQETRREELLAGLLGYIRTNGVADLSLRPLADALGTSPRMLIYHFGSKEQMLVEALKRSRETQFERLRQWSAAHLLPEVMRRYWQWASSHEFEPYTRLFFEVIGLALQGKPGTEGVVPAIVEESMDLFCPRLIEVGCEPGFAREEVGLAIATVRGLLIDVLATGDRERLDRTVAYVFDEMERRIARHIEGRESGETDQ